MSINRVVLTGRIVRDPEMRTTPSGQQVVNFSIAVQKRIKPTDPNERDAFFFRIVAWNKQAEFISNYATKGRMVGVEGRLEQRRYTGNDGIEREAVEVIADNVALLDRPRDDQGGGEYAPSDTAVANVASTSTEVDDYDPFAEE
ncbi:MAG: single-stranded DNA-binding protein [Fimbriimonadales bacterium]